MLRLKHFFDSHLRECQQEKCFHKDNTPQIKKNKLITHCSPIKIKELLINDEGDIPIEEIKIKFNRPRHLSRNTIEEIAKQTEMTLIKAIEAKQHRSASSFCNKENRKTTCNRIDDSENDIIVKTFTESNARLNIDRIEETRNRIPQGKLIILHKQPDSRSSVNLLNTQLTCSSDESLRKSIEIFEEESLPPLPDQMKNKSWEDFLIEAIKSRLSEIAMAIPSSPKKKKTRKRRRSESKPRAKKPPIREKTPSPPQNPFVRLSKGEKPILSRLQILENKDKARRSHNRLKSSYELEQVAKKKKLRRLKRQRSYSQELRNSHISYLATQIN